MREDRVESKLKNEQKFYASIDRLRYIQRWSLMRNNESENVAEHSFQTAIFAHALATLRKAKFPEQEIQVDPNLLLAKGIFHDASEAITGDLPTPVKYHDQKLKEAYKSLETMATEKLLQLLPDYLQASYESLLSEQDVKTLDKNSEGYVENRLLKAADKLSAYVKCIYEVSQGNNEFREAKKSTEEALAGFYAEFPEVKLFVDQFIPAFYLSLDQLKTDLI